MPKKRIRVGILSSGLILLSASRPTKPETTEVTLEGSVGQYEHEELAGTKTYPGTGGCNGTPARTVKVYRYYHHEQAAGTLRVVHTTKTNKTVSAEVSAYETRRTRSQIPHPNSDVEVKAPEYGSRSEAGTVLRWGSTKKQAHWELGAAAYKLSDKTYVAPSGMFRLSANGPYAFADIFGSSIAPLGPSASTGLGFTFANDKSLEGKITYGARKAFGMGLEGELPVGRRLRFKLGGISYSDGPVYDQWQAYTGLTLVTGRGVERIGDGR